MWFTSPINFLLNIVQTRNVKKRSMQPFITIGILEKNVCKNWDFLKGLV